MTVDLDTLTAAELQDLADAKRIAEYRAAEARTVEKADRLAELWNKPALGHYRRNLPPFDPPEVPAPPPRCDWTGPELAAAARRLAADCRDPLLDAEVIVAMGRRSGLADAVILAALRELP